MNRNSILGLLTSKQHLPQYLFVSEKQHTIEAKNAEKGQKSRNVDIV